MEDAQVKLSPPWWTLYRKIESTIGADSGVCIKPLYEKEGNYYIDIVIPDKPKARAMATVVKPVHKMGNITVYVQVMDPCGNVTDPLSLKGEDKVKALMRILKKAFKTNDLVVKILNIYGEVPPAVQKAIGLIVVVIAKEVIQFFNDQLNDYYSNYNEVAHVVFAEVLRLKYTDHIRISTTTELDRNVE